MLVLKILHIRLVVHMDMKYQCIRLNIPPPCEVFDTLRTGIKALADSCQWSTSVWSVAVLNVRWWLPHDTRIRHHRLRSASAKGRTWCQSCLGRRCGSERAWTDRSVGSHSRRQAAGSAASVPRRGGHTRRYSAAGRHTSSVTGSHTASPRPSHTPPAKSNQKLVRCYNWHGHLPFARYLAYSSGSSAFKRHKPQ